MIHAYLLGLNLIHTAAVGSFNRESGTETLGLHNLPRLCFQGPGWVVHISKTS